jgi:hypothetical protein
MNSASALAAGLADARRAEEDERAHRTARVLQARAAAAHRLGDGLDRLVLADDALVELGLHLAAALGLVLLEAVSGMPVILATSRRSSSSTAVDSWRSRHSLLISLLLLASCSALSRSGRALEVLRLDRLVLLALSARSRFSMSSGPAAWSSLLMRTRAPASSITSIALSGRKRPVM